jgi:hypothetical protein
MILINFSLDLNNYKGDFRMPSYSNITNLRILRDLKVFLQFKVGATRGPFPSEQLQGAELQRAQRRIKDLERQLAAESQELDKQRPPVFFIVGRGKSGTSWLMRMFNAHPEILCKGEGRFFGKDWMREDLRGRDWTAQDIRDEQTSVPPRSLYGAIRNSEPLRLWVERGVWSRDGDTEKHLAAIARGATDHFLREKLDESGKKIVGDKTPLLTPDFIKDIDELYPDAKVIHIIRDGRDVTVSAIHHRWNKADDRGGFFKLNPKEVQQREAYRQNAQEVLEEGLFSEKEIRGRARAWSNFVGQATEDGRKLLGDNYVEIRYEDLLENTEGEISRLLEFLGIDAREKNVRRCIEAASFEKMSGGRKPGEEDPDSFFRKGIAGDWKNVFTGRDRQVFKEAAGDLLIKLGYEKDGDW